MNKEYTWPFLVKEEVRKKLSAETLELLDELEDHLDIPKRGLTEPGDDVLAGWLLQAIAEKKITESEYVMLRERLCLDAILPKKILVVGDKKNLPGVVEQILKEQMDETF